jgi:hypothetical protein
MQDLRANLFVNGLSAEVLLDGDEDDVPLYRILVKIASVNLFLIVRKSKDEAHRVKVIGFDQGGAPRALEGTLPRIKDLFGWMESKLGYQGVVAAQLDTWLHVSDLAATPQAGWRGLVYSNTGSNTWTPNLDYAKKPAAVVVCEKPQAGGCVSRVIFRTPGSGDSLLENKVRWIGE